MDMSAVRGAWKITRSVGKGVSGWTEASAHAPTTRKDTICSEGPWNACSLDACHA
jgi:hypothetical protein